MEEKIKVRLNKDLTKYMNGLIAGSEFVICRGANVNTFCTRHGSE